MNGWFRDVCQTNVASLAKQVDDVTAQVCHVCMCAHVHSCGGLLARPELLEH